MITKIVKTNAVRCGALLLLAMCLTPVQADEPLHLLFYGNSFTRGTPYSSSSVPDLVRDIANAAGRPTPYVVSAAVGSRDFAWHLQNNTSPIANSIPSGETWDFVVLQNHTSMPTHIGNLAQHRADAVALYEVVADHSPDVTPVLFQTWARAAGHSFYTGTPPDFPGGPSQMQAELSEGYRLAAQDIDAKTGKKLARIAAVGDAWEEANWQNLHDPDLQHAQNRGTLLASLVIYSTIYGDRVTSDIDLTHILRSLRLTSQEGLFLTGVADSIAIPEPSSAACAALALGGLAVRARVDRRCRSVKCDTGLKTRRPSASCRPFNAE